MRRVILHGELGRRFGRTHRFDIATPMEAMRALRANHDGFESYMIEHSSPGYRVIVGRDDRTLATLGHPFGQREALHIVPMIEGSGNAFNMILGATLMIFAPELGYLASGLGTAEVGVASAAGAWVATAAGSLGFAMVLGGVAGLLFPPPKAPTAAAPGATTTNYAFSGVVNTVAQGNPVPICYGRLMVGSAVISAGLTLDMPGGSSLDANIANKVATVPVLLHTSK